MYINNEKIDSTTTEAPEKSPNSDFPAFSGTKSSMYLYDEIESKEIRQYLTIAVLEPYAIKSITINRLPWLSDQCLFELAEQTRKGLVSQRPFEFSNIDINLYDAIIKEIEARRQLEVICKIEQNPQEQKKQEEQRILEEQKIQREGLLIAGNSISEFLSGRLTEATKTGKAGRFLYGWATRQIQKLAGVTEDKAKQNILFPNPKQTAKEITEGIENVSNLIRSTTGSVLALLALRGARREFLLNLSKENLDSRLSAWGLEIFKLVCIFSKTGERKGATWRAQTQRLEATTAFYPIALNNRTKLDTRDMSADNSGKYKCTGLGANAINLHFTMDSATEVRSTLVAQHQIDGEPAIKLANRISQGEQQTDSISEISRNIRNAALALTDESYTNELLDGRKFRGIDYYQTNASEYGMLTKETESNIISLCIDGYEVLLAIRNSHGEIKSEEEIADDLKCELVIAHNAAKLRTLYTELLTTSRNDNERKRIYTEIQEKGLIPVCLDLRPSTASFSLIKGTKSIVDELKSQQTHRESQFDRLSTCLFRVSIDTSLHIDTEEKGEGLSQAVEKLEREHHQMIRERTSSAEELYQGSGFNNQISLALLKRERLIYEAPNDCICSVDVTEEWDKLKSGYERYLLQCVPSDRPDIQNSLIGVIKQMRGNAKLLEVLRYAAGKHPVNCVLGACKDFGLQITNTFKGSDRQRTELVKSFSALKEKYDKAGETVDQEILKYARIQFTNAITAVSRSMIHARMGETINSQLIELTQKAGELFASQPRFIQGFIKGTFVTVGKILPQFSSTDTKQLIKQLSRIDLRSPKEVICAEVEMFMTNMMYPISGLYEDIAGNETLSVPKTERTGAGVSATSATSRKSEMIMINEILDGTGKTRTIITFRGRNIEKTRKELLEAIDIYSQVFSGRVVTALANHIQTSMI